MWLLSREHGGLFLFIRAVRVQALQVRLNYIGPLVGLHSGRDGLIGGVEVTAIGSRILNAFPFLGGFKGF